MQAYSVALCTYNGAKYISEQLESIIKQTIPPSQIVISDDGSKDNTIEIVDTILQSSGIRYQIVHNTTKHGVTSNFQNAFSYCTSPIIFCSDQDDVWVNNKAEKMLHTYEAHPEAQVVFSDGELVDSNLNLLGCTVWRAVGITSKRINEGDWFHYLLKTCLVTGAAMSFKKHLLNDVEEIPVEWLHDGWLTWAAVTHNGLVPCNERLFYYRQHGNNEVGMAPVYDIKGRIKGWFKKIDAIKEMRRIRYNRYLSLYNTYRHKFTETQQKEIKKCVSFWGVMIKSEEKSSIKSLFTYCNYLFNGSYSMYYNGFKGFIRDVLLLFLVRQESSSRINGKTQS